MHNSTLMLRLAAVMLVALYGASGAGAETSSWVGRSDGPAEPAAKKKAEPKGAPVKAIKTVPGTLTVLPVITPSPAPGTQTAPIAPAASPAPSRATPPAAAAPAAPKAPVTPGPSGSEYAKTPAPGEDAAYEAFDQGKYLTALQLAAKAAELGDPQAHTLVGRIYAEGYGTSKNSALAAQWYARGAELGDPEAMFALGVRSEEHT